jgi:hypothetical protein
MIINTQVVFTLLVVFYLPSIVPYNGYIPVPGENGQISTGSGTEYEPLHGGEEFFPERHVNILSSMYIE